jgi:hypothetical protein
MRSGCSLWAAAFGYGHEARTEPRGLGALTANGAARGDGAGSSPARRIPARSGKRPTRHRHPTGDSRHDHPDAPARRRGHPWPLVAAPGVTTTSTLGLGERHNPTARSARDFHSPLRVPKALHRAKSVTQSHLRSSTEPHYLGPRRQRHPYLPTGTLRADHGTCAELPCHWLGEGPVRKLRGPHGFVGRPSGTLRLSRTQVRS